MANLRIFKELALPATPELNAMYLVANPTNPNHVEIFITGNTADNVKHIVTKTEVDNAISTAIAAALSGQDPVSSLEVVANITARNALTLTSNTLVLVTDATEDTTVKAGAATYVYVAASETWTKVSEYESLDVVQSWTNLQGKPTSTTAQIDAAVSASHTHANMTVLDKLTIVGDKLAYDNVVVDSGSIELASNNW